jgi:phospholipid/cholesterol/gamma-HCH transport system substrate-binding protein
MNRNVLETVMGALVLAVALIFLVFAYSAAGIRTVSGYEVSAKFDHIDGIKAGTDVRISGIKVGTVTGTSLDPKTYEANVRMTIDKAYELPVDTIAVITSAGLLGDNTMSLTIGADETMIQPGGVIKETQSPISLASMLGQVIYSVTNGAKPPADGAQAPAGQ